MVYLFGASDGLCPNLLSGRAVITKELRVNERIRAREVRVIGDAGEQLGIMPLYQALQTARDRSLDLVEVAPTAVPPVCRLLDYGRYKYEQTKKEREARKHQKATELKEMRMRLKIDEHDIAFKVRNVEKFLQQGDKVKVTVMFRGREVSHWQLGRELLERVARDLKGIAGMERPPIMEGRNMSIVLVPLPAGKRTEAAKAAQPVQPTTEEGVSAPAQS